MRIIGGKYKGRVFHPGKKFKSRPTTDIAKEGLFNILDNRFHFDELNILDLFSGTGSMGYEFASRGANELVMVERNFGHFKFIRETLKNLNIQNARVIKGDAFLFLKKSSATFDIIFADPPFDMERIAELPDAVFSRPVLAENGVFILEHSKDQNFSNHPHFSELRKYGKVNFSFFR